MLIRRPPILLCLTSKELETESFTLSSQFQQYQVHAIPPQDGDAPSRIEIIDCSNNDICLTLAWDERRRFYLFANKHDRSDDRIFAGQYRIVADKPGAFVYMAPGNVMGSPNYSDAIYLMADTIVDLENRIKALERHMSESRDRFEQIEADISA